jgi:N-formylglutamate amidohydrolase
MLSLEAPAEPAVPLLLDSPHSGTYYPVDFKFDCPEVWLRQTEDALVDVLFAAAPKQGITLLKAEFARSYIDVNRAEDDIDPRVIEGTLPANPTERSLAGHGLIRTTCRGAQVYNRKLNADDVKHRIATCYTPYHATLSAALSDLHARFGSVWHINCHSMPSAGFASSLSTPPPQADFVIGDRDGTTCEKAFTAIVTQTLRAMGYRVAQNDPYKGVEIIARNGKPQRAMHSLQLEINRALYLDERTLEPNAGFDKLRANLNKAMGEWREWALRRAAPQRQAAE